MSKYKLLIALLMLPVAALAQNAHYTIQGKIGTYNAPAKAYLINGSTVDSAVLHDGKFTFTGTVAAPVICRLGLNIEGTGGYEDHGQREFWLEPGTTTLTAIDDRIGGDGLTITGSKTNLESDSFYLARQPMFDINNYIEAIEGSVTADEKATPEFHKKMHDARVRARKIKFDVYQRFISAHRDSYVSLDAMKFLIYESEYTVIKPLYDLLSPALKNTKEGKALAAKLPAMKRVALGEIAPEFTEADSSGRMISLSSFRGKYVLIDFWASWCGPCRAENPNVLRAYNKFKGRNFTVLGVAIDQSREEWIKAIVQDGMPWNEVIDKKTGKLYGVLFIPQNFLIDPQGRIISKNLLGNDLEDELEAILN